MNYEERESFKSDAWDIINSKDSNIHLRAYGVLNVIEAHYYRALEFLELMPKIAQRRIYGKRYCPGYVMSIDVYTRHWLAANKHIPVKYGVMKYLKDEFGYEPEESKFLPTGRSIYILPNPAGRLNPRPLARHNAASF